MKNFKFTLLILLSSFYFFADAQNYSWQLLTMDNGLASNKVNTIFIESENAIWLGTDQGLSFFDGENVTNYTLSNSNIVDGNVLEIIKVKNDIWLRTDAGVSSFDGTSFTNYDETNELITKETTSITGTTYGYVWIGSEKGLVTYDGRQFTKDSSISSYKIIADDENNVYSFGYNFISGVVSTIKFYNNGNWIDVNAPINESKVILSAINKNEMGEIALLPKEENFYYEIKHQPFDVVKKPLQYFNRINNSSFTSFIAAKTIWAISNSGEIFNGTGSIIKKMPMYYPFTPNTNLNPLSPLNDIKASKYNIYIASDRGLLHANKSIQSDEEYTTNFSVNEISTNVVAGYTPFTQEIVEPNFEFPKGQGIHGIFSNNFITLIKDKTQNKWLSNTIDSYLYEPFNYGPVNTSFGINNYYIAKVSQAEIDAHKSSFNSSGYTIPKGIKDWPAVGDSALGMAADLAPFVDVNNNGCYDPENGDYPIIKGDEAIYWINHNSSLKDVPLEYHYMMYAYNNPSDQDINQTIFVDFKIVNRGKEDIDSAKVGIYVDGDLGYPFDDYVGSDSINDLFYFYNGNAIDPPSSGGHMGYGGNAPAVGIKTLSEPMTNFITFNASPANNGTPVEANHWLHYTNSQWKDGSNLTYGGDGYLFQTTNIPTSHMFTGDPNSNTGWTEINAGTTPNPPGDRIGFGSIDYFSLNSGASKTISIAYGYGRAIQNISPSQNISEVIDVLNHAKAVWDTISHPAYNYGQNYNCLEEHTGIEKYEEDNQLVVYPVPAKNILNVEANEKIHRIQLFDMQGRLIYSKAQQQNHLKINIDNYSKGIYFLNVEMENGDIINRKIVIQK